MRVMTFHNFMYIMESFSINRARHYIPIKNLHLYIRVDFVYDKSVGH